MLLCVSSFWRFLFKCSITFLRFLSHYLCVQFDLFNTGNLVASLTLRFSHVLGFAAADGLFLAFLEWLALLLLPEALAL
jgi:hypothetical protein